MKPLFVIAGRRLLGTRPALVKRAALALAAFAAGPTQAAMHDMAMPVEAGHVHLQTSCAPAAAADINRGVSLLYAFWYDPARRSFQKAEAEQPACAMAWWGEAMSDWQQIKSLPEGPQLKAGQIALARARAASVKSPREAAYIDALAVIFDPAVRPDPAARVTSQGPLHGRRGCVASGRILCGGCLPKATRLRRADGVAEDARDARDKAHECGGGYKGQPGMPVYLPFSFGMPASQIR